MIRNILTHIGGIENFGLISIGLFFTFFLGMLIWAFGRQRSYLDAMSVLPLERDPQDSLTPATPDSEARHE